jgi:hypothetical protein
MSRADEVAEAEKRVRVAARKLLLAKHDYVVAGGNYDNACLSLDILKDIHGSLQNPEPKKSVLFKTLNPKNLFSSKP